MQSLIHSLTHLLQTHKNQRVSSKEDEPAMRVLRQRELVDNYKNENEVTRLGTRF